MPRPRPVGVAYPDWLRARVLEASPFETTRSIARRLGISQATVSRWICEPSTHGTATGPRLHTCTLSKEDAAFLCVLKLTYPQASLMECKLALLLERNKDVSLATVSREIKRLGMTRKVIQRFSNRRDEDRRVAWWTTPPHLGGCAGVDWSNLVDIDEANVKFGDSQRKYGHAFSGHAARVSSFVSLFFIKYLHINQTTAESLWQVPELAAGSFTCYGCCCLYDLSRRDEQSCLLPLSPSTCSSSACWRVSQVFDA